LRQPSLAGIAHLQIGLVLLEDLRADALDVQHLVHRTELAVALAIIDDRLRAGEADPVEFLRQRCGVGAVQVASATITTISLRICSLLSPSDIEEGSPVRVPTS
jgi:hypothetical protein